VARDRKRTRPRAAAPLPDTPDANLTPDDPDDLTPNLPGSLEHVGDVDAFDAELIHGAKLGEAEENGATNGHADALELAPGNEEALAAFGEEDTGPTTLPSRRERAAAAPRTGGGGPIRKAIAFLGASWAELQRVQWPDRRQVAQATAVVLGFVAVAGVYLGVADWVAQKIVNFVL